MDEREDAPGDPAPALRRSGKEAEGAARRGGRAARPSSPPAAGRAPDAAALREAALAHLARFAATEAGLARVLLRRVDRWARRAEAEGQPPERIAAVVAPARAAVPEIARRLAAAGAVDDGAFAASRARRLAQSGRSTRAIRAHLAAKGVPAATAEGILEENPPDELAAALAQLRRRRAGPFAPEPPSPEARLKALGALARAGFARDVAQRALDLPPEEAETRLLEARRG
ncbi:regulatory protein RecX [Pseudoroseomonas cervicalis]|uniref:regulatory protein RecX n=1 Tax=Teichococcus cervicalis TaxID=204525 RepID=UPI0022F15405|nr:RecX family transcriptional regulator [Pseudoroseomonas cervicalis]WBV42636.1 RecX family transcriptional regulator [Pseudoroseomonas cervicalis]